MVWEEAGRGNGPSELLVVEVMELWSRGWNASIVSDSVFGPSTVQLEDLKSGSHFHR